MTHKDCVALTDPQRAVAVNTVRAWSLIVASLRHDNDASRQTLDEVEGCAECLSALVYFLVSSTSSAFTSLAGGNKQAAINQAEKLLREAVYEAGNI